MPRRRLRLHSGPDCTGCDQRLDDPPCEEIGGHLAVNGPCEATHCPLHLGADRLGLPYVSPRDVCTLHLLDTLEGTLSQADVARILRLSEETIRRAELAATPKVIAAKLQGER